MLECALYVCWVTTELISPGHWDHSSQVMGEANSLRRMVRCGLSFPKCGEHYGGTVAGVIRVHYPRARGVQSQFFWSGGEGHSGLTQGEASSARPWYSNIMFKTWFSTWFIRAHVVIKTMYIHMLEDISGW